jgi:hypothetical protein
MENFKRILWFLIWPIMPVALFCQTMEKDYIYGCENCVISKFRQIGKNKLLFDYSNINRRQLILLDTQNLVVDKLGIEAPMSICVNNDQEFSIPDVNFTANIKIVGNRMEMKSLFMIHSSVELHYPIFVKGKGFISLSSRTCGAESYISQLIFLDTSVDVDSTKVYQIDAKKNLYYRRPNQDVINYISRKDIQGKGSINDHWVNQPIINANCEEISRRKNGPGFHSYEIDDKILMFFRKESQKLYYVELEPRPKLLGSITLPLSIDETGAWHHFYDHQRHLSYFVYEKGRSSEKSAKEYLLYRLEGKELKKISSLNYLPADIEEGKVYELRQDKKSYHIYGHPFVEPPHIDRIFLDTH